jgi:hypothetical protein
MRTIRALCSPPVTPVFTQYQPAGCRATTSKLFSDAENTDIARQHNLHRVPQTKEAGLWALASSVALSHPKILNFETVTKIH